MYSQRIVSLVILFTLLNNSLQSSEDKNSTLGEDKIYDCATIDFEICEVVDNESGDCSSRNRTYPEIQWVEGKSSTRVFQNVTNLFQISSGMQCHLTLCDDYERMGYCVQFPPGVSVSSDAFKNILMSDLVGIDCRCSEETRNGSGVPFSNEEFDRNYVGVVYSPYDKYWESNGRNNTLTRVSWSDYSEDEITHSLRQVSKKFSYIATYGMGTASNTSEWYNGDKIAFVPYLSAKINADLGYLALRVSIGIFRKDDVTLEWKSKEMYNAIDAAKVANQEFNGTVWGITVTSDYVKDEVKASDAIQMIEEVKAINERDRLRLKVGIRLKTCAEFIADKRPEDDAVPIYTQENPFINKTVGTNTSVNVISVTGFQASLYKIARIITIIQSQYIKLRDTLRQINPKLKLFIETGVPSQGIGNGYKNSLENFRDFWRNTSDFAKRNNIMFHMFEATDQPWKNVHDGSSNRFDINGPNGTDAHFGWWKRYNNSEPPIYIEKIKEINDSVIVQNKVDEKVEHSSDFTFNIVILCFVGFVLATISIVAYLYRKLHKAKTQVISQTYVDQFHSGGDDNVDENYAVALKIPYDKKLELIKGTFYIDKSAVMGSGQSGTVCRGKIQCKPGFVAFKCTSPRSTVVDIKAIMSEIKILSYIGHHENLVCILGAYTKKIQRGIVYIALEYCELGNLESFLRKAEFKEMTRVEPIVNYENLKDSIRYVTISTNTCASATNPGYITDLSPFNPPKNRVGASYVTPSELNVAFTESPTKNTVTLLTMLQWSQQIASAMEYISMKNVVHADLAARNVLLASMTQVKVSDFGLSRKMYQEMGVTHDKDTPLPWRWMSIESLKHLSFSSQSDVWAYGITLWEIFSMAEVPYHGISYDMNFAERLLLGMRLPMAKYSNIEIHEEMNKCWSTTPSMRPSFKQLEHFFRNLVEQQVVYQKGCLV